MIEIAEQTVLAEVERRLIQEFPGSRWRMLMLRSVRLTLGLMRVRFEISFRCSSRSTRAAILHSITWQPTPNSAWVESPLPSRPGRSHADSDRLHLFSPVNSNGRDTLPVDVAVNRKVISGRVR